MSSSDIFWFSCNSVTYVWVSRAMNNGEQNSTVLTSQHVTLRGTTQGGGIDHTLMELRYYWGPVSTPLKQPVCLIICPIKAILLEVIDRQFCTFITDRLSRIPGLRHFGSVPFSSKFRFTCLNFFNTRFHRYLKTTNWVPWICCLKFCNDIRSITLLS